MAPSWMSYPHLLSSHLQNRDDGPALSRALSLAHAYTMNNLFTLVFPRGEIVP
jgi:hypothetical protein